MASMSSAVVSESVTIMPLADLQAHVGREVACSDWFLVDAARVAAFAEVTGDLQWIHLDAERCARESPFGVPVAHGYLTLSLLPHLMQAALQIDGVAMAVNYGLDRVRFPAPLPVGTRVRARLTLDAVSDLPKGGVQAHWTATVEAESGERPVCVAQLLARYFPAA
jgi:acyl dehydratase